MVGLLDIVAVPTEVEIRGYKLEVGGVTARGIAYLLADFPELRKLMTGQELGEITPDRLMDMFPQAVAAIIAAGLGHPGDKGYITAAEKLSVGEQMELLKAIIPLTFPQGLNRFLDALDDLTSEVDVSGWAQATRSPGQSRNSEPADTQEPSTTHPAN